MRTDHLTIQSSAEVAENESQLQADANLEVVLSQRTYAKPLVRVRVTEGLFERGKGLANIAPQFLRQVAQHFAEFRRENGALQSAMSFSRLPEKCFRVPARSAAFSLKCCRFLNPSHSSGVTPYSWKR